MVEFAWPWVGLAALLPLVAAYALPPARGTMGAALRVPFFAAARRWAGHGPGLHRWRLAAALLAWLALVVAACRPQWIGEPTGLPVTGRDMLLAVDLSGSMKTQDLKFGAVPVSRLHVVKRVGGSFIERRIGDRIGLILFGSRAYLQTPLTFDRTTVQALLDESVIGLAGEQTAIGDAIGLAVKRLRRWRESNRILVLLTDGANTAGEIDPLEAAELAATEGLTIYTIGVGADEMLVRRLFGTRRINPSAELDEKTLSAIAEMTGGRYFRARNTEELEEIYQLLDALEPAARDEDWFRPTRELFHWPLAGALLISVMASVPALVRAAPTPGRGPARPTDA